MARDASPSSLKCTPSSLHARAALADMTLTFMGMSAFLPCASTALPGKRPRALALRTPPFVHPLTPVHAPPGKSTLPCSPAGPSTTMQRAGAAARCSYARPEPHHHRDKKDRDDDRIGTENFRSERPIGDNAASALSRIVEDALHADRAAAAPDDAPASRAPPAPLPVQLDLLAYHARVAVRSGDTGAAEALFRRAVTLNPVDGRAWLGLARLAASARPPRPAEARKTFRAGVAASRRNPHLLQAWGVFEERSGNLARAKGLFEAATHADPSHCASWVALGLWEQRHARDLYAARECFQKGADADPQNYYVWHVWGMLEQSMRNIAAARECFQTGVKANPQNAPTYVAWGVLEARLRNYTIAEQLFLHAQRANPRNAHALVAHAVLATRGGRQGKARALLDMALAVKPRDPAVYQTYGLLEAQAGRLDAARRRFQQGAEVNPKHGPIWLAWGIMEQTAGDLARARQLFQQGVWSNPTSPHIVRIWHAWARLERSDGKLDSARKLFGHGLGADPTSVAILSNWAVLEAENHNMPFARDMLEKAVQLQPEHNDLWKLYVSLERDHGTDERAHMVAQRAALCEHQKERRLVVSEPLPGDFTAAGMWIDPADVDLTAVADSSMIIADPLPAPVRDDARALPVVRPAAADKKKRQNTTTTLHDKVPRRARDAGRRMLPHLSPKPVLRRTVSPRGGADLGTEAGYLNYMMAFSFMDGGLA